MGALLVHTEAEAQARDSLIRHGYTEVEEFNGLRPGALVRLRSGGQGVIVSVLHHAASAWSMSWGAPDVELVVRRDSATRPLAQVANYHVSLVADGAS